MRFAIALACMAPTPRPGDLKAAWIWRQYNDELERRWRFSLPDIVRQIDAVTAGINEATIGLVDRPRMAPPEATDDP